MGVRLVEKTERFIFKIDDDAAIYYRRLSTAEKREITAKHTKKGIVDYTAAGMEMLKSAVLGWKGIEDSTGEVKFEKEKILLLPDEITMELIDLLSAKTGEIDKKK